MTLCIRPEDVTASRGSSSTTTGLSDETLVDRAGTLPSAAAFVGTRRLKVIRQTYQPGGRHHPHQHEATEQTYYVVCGEARVRIGSEVFNVSAGTLLYIPPKTEHEIENTGKTPLVNLLICVDLDADEVV